MPCWYALFAALFIGAPVLCRAQGQLADYERAAVFQKARDLVFRGSLQPHWIAQGDRFWYLDRLRQSKTFVLVDPDRNRQSPAFDHSRLAQSLSIASGSALRAEALPFDAIEYSPDGAFLSFEVNQIGWRCELAAYRCAPLNHPPGARPGEVLSPDGHWAVFLKDHNLWLRDTQSDARSALTSDGAPHYDYASYDGISTSPVTDVLSQTPPEPEVHFSPNSRRLLTYRIDAREVRELALTQTLIAARPVSHVFRYPLAGDSAVAKIQMMLVDLLTKSIVPVRYAPFERVTSFAMPVAWNTNSTQVGFVEEERGFRAVRFHVVDAVTGALRTPILERAEKYINRKSQARFVGGDLVWLSERDGWNHLYDVDGPSGAVKRQLTRGDWLVRDMKHVDEKRRLIYFVAGGRERGADPYYRFLYRVHLDGSGLELLTPELADHEIAFAPTGRYFVDTYSRIDLPPRTVVRSAEGRLVRELQRADISRLIATGWKPPEAFKVKARDGTTDLYGAIIRPSHFDPAKRYPVLDGVYPGPQLIRTAKAFDLTSYWAEDDLALAELGFIVVTLDGMGTPMRSRAFREVSYGNMGDAGGLEDHVAGLKQLAARYSSMDLQRVGIFGHSGGGYASVRAMLKYPDFYQVAVSSSGNHDQRTYWAEWGERFQGYPVGGNYVEQANASLAGALKGKLLLAYGDLDDNVPPANTLQLVDALIAANKDFDLLVLPNRNHALANLAAGAAASARTDPYFLRRRWDYFVEHLLGVTPPKEFALH